MPYDPNRNDRGVGASHRVNNNGLHPVHQQAEATTTRRISTPQQFYFPQPEEEERLSPPPPPPPTRAFLHREQEESFSRYSHLNLEFLWKIYHQRKNTNRNDNHSRIETLKSQGFPAGLASLILEHSMDHPIRLWLVDNRGTMHKSDGHLVSQSIKQKVETVDCTRWEEITSTILWHAEMAAWCQTPMAIRLLHDPGVQVGPQQVGVSASKHYSSKEEVERLRNLLNKTRPNGLTSPLYLHMKQLFPSIQQLVPILDQTHKRITLCVCTDSIPTDEDGEEHPGMIQEFLVTLQQLVNWPVQVVIRLSTDEERVVQFYQNLFAEHTNLANHLQVLDDYVSECYQVQKHNPWLHYGYPLHLCREEGIRISVLEALSVRPLLPIELCQLVSLIFGVIIPRETHDPEGHFAEFRKLVVSLNRDAIPLWNPLKKKFVPWIDVKKMDKMHNSTTSNSGDKCSIM